MDTSKDLNLVIFFLSIKLIGCFFAIWFIKFKFHKTTREKPNIIFATLIWSCIETLGFIPLIWGLLYITGKIKMNYEIAVPVGVILARSIECLIMIKWISKKTLLVKEIIMPMFLCSIWTVIFDALTVYISFSFFIMHW